MFYKSTEAIFSRYVVLLAMKQKNLLDFTEMVTDLRHLIVEFYAYR